MQNPKMIEIETFCRYHHVEKTFVFSVQEEGLIEIVASEEGSYIPEEKLSVLEKIIRLHQELEINPKGIGAVLHLLDKIESLQRENHALKNKLKRFKSEL
jgi:chaperone modulatory protein CbpM